MPHLKEKERQEIARKTAAFLDQGGEIERLEITDRKEVEKLAKIDYKILNGRDFITGV